MARQRTVLLSQVASGSGGPSSSTDVAYFDSNGKLTGDSDLTYTASGGPLSTTGRMLTGFGTVALPAYSFGGDTDTGMYRYGANILGWSLGGALTVYHDSTTLSLGSAVRLAWSSTTAADGSDDVILGRISAGVLGFSTDNAQAFGNATHRASNIFATLGTFSSLVTFTTSSGTIVLKQGANGTCGTFVANGATPVTVTNSNVAISDAIIISLNTVGGTVGIQPHVATITAATGFTVVCTATDTSTYNYAIIKNAA